MYLALASHARLMRVSSDNHIFSSITSCFHMGVLWDVSMSEHFRSLGQKDRIAVTVLVIFKYCKRNASRVTQGAAEHDHKLGRTCLAIHEKAGER